MGILGSFYEAFLNRVHIVIGIISYRSKVRNILLYTFWPYRPALHRLCQSSFTEMNRKIAESIMETQLDSLDSAVKQL